MQWHCSSLVFLGWYPSESKSEKNSRSLNSPAVHCFKLNGISNRNFRCYFQAKNSRLHCSLFGLHFGACVPAACLESFRRFSRLPTGHPPFSLSTNRVHYLAPLIQTLRHCVRWSLFTGFVSFSASLWASGRVSTPRGGSDRFDSVRIISPDIPEKLSKPFSDNEVRSVLL